MTDSASKSKKLGSAEHLRIVSSKGRYLNYSGRKLKVKLWGDATFELTANLDGNGVNPHPVVVVVAGAYVKQYLGKAFLSSKNATKIYFDIDIPEVLHVRERSSHRSPPREITLPPLMPERQYLNWFRPNGNLGTTKLCCAKVVCVSAEKDCYYLGCNNCTTELVGSTDDLWCHSCKVQVGEPGLATVKAAFEPLLGVFHDYLIMLTPYNMKTLETTSFTVKLPLIPQAATAPVSTYITEASSPEDVPMSDSELARKKPCLQQLA
ncbi:hypothetical protein MKX01_030205 [Papaver californicum]|nr:hypothetical protein MKX01_030205 [Papaver californicum]